MKKYWVIVLIVVLFFIAGIYFIWRYNAEKSSKVSDTDSPMVDVSPNYSAMPIISESPLILPSVSQTSENRFAVPINDFLSRITKKPFGIYITPATSPVQPERFSGYHNAIDVEYEDIAYDVPVYAIADGVIVFSDWVSGYGGAFMLEFDIDGIKHNALYGHIRPASLPKVGDAYKKGEQIAVLGTGYSNETDGERRHLHFGILSDNRIDARGYVQSEGELSGWINSISLYWI